MESLANTTELLENTTAQLMDEEKAITPQVGISLIDQWIGPLSEGENTLPIAEGLKTLKTLLQAEPVDSEAVMGQMGSVAAKVLLIAPDMGAEGEMPSLLSGLAAALRMSGDQPEKELGA